MKCLVEKANASAASLGATRHDIKNKADIIKKARNHEAEVNSNPKQVSPSDANSPVDSNNPTPRLLSNSAASSIDNSLALSLVNHPSVNSNNNAQASTEYQLHVDAANTLFSLKARSSMPSTCAWPNCCMSENSPDKCCECNASVHRLCQAEGEAVNQWNPLVESKLYCFVCHPDNLTSPPTVAAATTTANDDATVTTLDTATTLNDASNDATALNTTVDDDVQPQRNKGGRPVGSTDENKRAAIFTRKKQ